MNTVIKESSSILVINASMVELFCSVRQSGDARFVGSCCRRAAVGIVSQASWKRGENMHGR